MGSPETVTNLYDRVTAIGNFVISLQMVRGSILVRPVTHSVDLVVCSKPARVNSVVHPVVTVVHFEVRSKQPVVTQWFSDTSPCWFCGFPERVRGAT